jgi:hypothetical protein
MMKMELTDGYYREIIIDIGKSRLRENMRKKSAEQHRKYTLILYEDSSVSLNHKNTR